MIDALSFLYLDCDALSVGEVERLDLGILGHRLVDVAAADHRVEHDELALLGHHEVDVGGVERGRVGQAREHGGFGQGELARPLAEVALGGRADAVVVRAVVDGVEVHLEDLVLRVVPLHVEREEEFLRLAAEGLLVREEEVLDELLRDGARALLNLARLQVDERRARDALEVEAVVAVEAPVLDGDDGLLQRLAYPAA